MYFKPPATAVTVKAAKHPPLLLKLLFEEPEAMDFRREAVSILHIMITQPEEVKKIVICFSLQYSLLLEVHRITEL